MAEVRRVPEMYALGVKDPTGAPGPSSARFKAGLSRAALRRVKGRIKIQPALLVETSTDTVILKNAVTAAI